MGGLPPLSRPLASAPRGARVITSAEAQAPRSPRPNILLGPRGRSETSGRPPKGLYRDRIWCWPRRFRPNFLVCACRAAACRAEGV